MSVELASARVLRRRFVPIVSALSRCSKQMKHFSGASEKHTKREMAKSGGRRTSDFSLTVFQMSEVLIGCVRK
jgi:hypothetical protein